MEHTGPLVLVASVPIGMANFRIDQQMLDRTPGNVGGKYFERYMGDLSIGLELRRRLTARTYLQQAQSSPRQVPYPHTHVDNLQNAPDAEGAEVTVLPEHRHYLDV